MPKEIFDLSEIARFKQKFNYELKPIKDMLLHRRKKCLQINGWISWSKPGKVS